MTFADCVERLNLFATVVAVIDTPTTQAILTQAQGRNELFRYDKQQNTLVTIASNRILCYLADDDVFIDTDYTATTTSGKKIGSVKKVLSLHRIINGELRRISQKDFKTIKIGVHGALLCIEYDNMFVSSAVHRVLLLDKMQYIDLGCDANNVASFGVLWKSEEHILLTQHVLFSQATVVIHYLNTLSGKQTHINVPLSASNTMRFEQSFASTVLFGGTQCYLIAKEDGLYCVPIQYVDISTQSCMFSDGIKLAHTWTLKGERAIWCNGNLLTKPNGYVLLSDNERI